jgi:hypothetical protein
MRGRERQQWIEFVRRREERKADKLARKRRRKKPEPTQRPEKWVSTQEELEAALDDLVREAERRGVASSTPAPSE